MRQHPKQTELLMKKAEKLAKGDRKEVIKFMVGLGLMLIGLILLAQ